MIKIISKKFKLILLAYSVLAFCSADSHPLLARKTPTKRRTKSKSSTKRRPRKQGNRSGSAISPKKILKKRARTSQLGSQDANTGGSTTEPLVQASSEVIRDRSTEKRIQQEPAETTIENLGLTNMDEDRHVGSHVKPETMARSLKPTDVTSHSGPMNSPNNEATGSGVFAERIEFITTHQNSSNNKNHHNNPQPNDQKQPNDQSNNPMTTTHTTENNETATHENGAPITYIEKMSDEFNAQKKAYEEYLDNPFEKVFRQQQKLQGNSPIILDDKFGAEMNKEIDKSRNNGGNKAESILMTTANRFKNILKMCINLENKENIRLQDNYVRYNIYTLCDAYLNYMTVLWGINYMKKNKEKFQDALIKFESSNTMADFVKKNKYQIEDLKPFVEMGKNLPPFQRLSLDQEYQYNSPWILFYAKDEALATIEQTPLLLFAAIRAIEKELNKVNKGNISFAELNNRTTNPTGCTGTIITAAWQVLEAFCQPETTFEKLEERLLPTITTTYSDVAFIYNTDHIHHGPNTLSSFNQRYWKFLFARTIRQQYEDDGWQPISDRFFLFAQNDRVLSQKDVEAQTAINHLCDPENNVFNPRLYSDLARLFTVNGVKQALESVFKEAKDATRSKNHNKYSPMFSGKDGKWSYDAENGLTVNNLDQACIDRTLQNVFDTENNRDPKKWLNNEVYNRLKIYTHVIYTHV